MSHQFWSCSQLWDGHESCFGKEKKIWMDQEGEGEGSGVASLAFWYSCMDIKFTHFSAMPLYSEVKVAVKGWFFFPQPHLFMYMIYSIFTAVSTLSWKQFAPRQSHFVLLFLCMKKNWILQPKKKLSKCIFFSSFGTICVGSSNHLIG